MPEQLLALSAAGPERGDQEPEVGPREAIGMTALRVLRASRMDVEALDLTAERLRHLQVAFTKAADASRPVRTATLNRPMPMERTRCASTISGRTARRSPDRTAAGRPATERTDAAHPMPWCAPTMPGVHTRVACPAKGTRGVWIGF
ncbi:hypothetical protein [Streptomyces barringtoniae]|uniref:hypothetical protein n=1 Tax=Streptomyces barringtoniae TaxID=2892029 RepID=UPI001E5A8EAB|nr:hypothetical protein [Streptomyces barringtoniae]MCC5481157.1 hypothetical protein [Streptomyces barringtoniae]